MRRMWSISVLALPALCLYGSARAGAAAGGAAAPGLCTQHISKHKINIRAVGCRHISDYIYHKQVPGPIFIFVFCLCMIVSLL